MPPLVGTVAQKLYDDLEPVAYADPDNGYPLLVLCGAIGLMLQPVSDLASDTPAGPGWSQLLDVDRAPTAMLGYLGQFVGVALNPLLDDAAQRQRIRETAGMKRGTPAAIAGAARQFLTGTQAVVIRERFNPDVGPADAPYHFQVLTFTDETPDSAAVLAALTAQKPAGLVLHYNVVDGQDFEQVRENFTTFDLLRLGYTTFDGMRTNTP